MPAKKKPSPDNAIRSAATTFVDRVVTRVFNNELKPVKGQWSMKTRTKATKQRTIAIENTEAERLVRAFRAIAREFTRQLPGRAQKGAVDAALRSVVPIIEKKLKA